MRFLGEYKTYYYTYDCMRFFFSCRLQKSLVNRMITSRGLRITVKYFYICFVSLKYVSYILKEIKTQCQFFYLSPLVDTYTELPYRVLWNDQLLYVVIVSCNILTCLCFEDITVLTVSYFFWGFLRIFVDVAHSLQIYCILCSLAYWILLKTVHIVPKQYNQYGQYLIYVIDDLLSFPS